MKRDWYLSQIGIAYRSHPVVALLGSRQVGKSTLAHSYSRMIKTAVHFFDLEDPVALAKLDAPMLALGELTGLVIIDEIQRRPELFPIIRVLADKKKCKFLILGSVSKEILQQASETLAGRIAYIEVSPFSVKEKINLPHLWIYGGYPRAYLAKGEAQAKIWLKNYITTFLEQDIPQLGFRIPSATMRKFWMMLTHYHGGIMNAAEIGGSLGISGQTVRRYLDILTRTFLIRELQPWHINIDKRQIKTPKIYFRDSGLYHQLLGLEKLSSIQTSPKLGASWEGFALEQVVAKLNFSSEEIFFWGTHSHAELDLYTHFNGKKIGFEFKFTDAPKMTKSMSIVLEDLKLDHLYVLYPGKENFKISPKVTAVALMNIENLL